MKIVNEYPYIAKTQRNLISCINSTYLVIRRIINGFTIKYATTTKEAVATFVKLYVDIYPAGGGIPFLIS